jgi:chromosome partitioning protein
MARILIDNIKQRRKDLSMTQTDLASVSGLSLSLIKLIESNRTESTKDNFEKIADALNTDLEGIYIDDFRETKVISIANNKGGSGKTTVSGNLAYALSMMGCKILLIDSDMQMNLSKSYGFEENVDNSIYNAFLKEESLLKYINKTDYENIDMIISDYDMALADMMIFAKLQRENIFRNILAPVIETGLYDYVLIDTNPTLGITNLNCLSGSDFGIIPVELSKFGIDGLSTIFKFINNSVKKINSDFKVIGVLYNKVDLRENITELAQEVIRKVFDGYIFNTQISTDTSVKKAQWVSTPVSVYSTKTRAAKQYKDLAKEVIKLAK